jgi:hypothetical protein
MEQQTITYTYEEHSVVVDFTLPDAGTRVPGPEGAVRVRSHSQDAAQQTSPQGNRDASQKVQDVTDLTKVVTVQPARVAAPALDNPLNLPPTTIAALKANLTQELAAAIVADPRTPEEIAAQDARCKRIKMIAAILGITVVGSAVTAGFALLGVSLQ